jgi:hypothetical protein
VIFVDRNGESPGVMLRKSVMADGGVVGMAGKRDDAGERLRKP